MKIVIVFAALFATLSRADEATAHRGLRFGKFGRDGPRGGPGGADLTLDAEITCAEPVPCNLRVKGSPGEVDVNGGIRICRQHPFDETRNRTICVENTDPIMGLDTDECGCCNGPCPETACSTCDCEKTDDDGNVLYTGFEMVMTGCGRDGNNRTKTVCVAEEFTIDAQIRGGTCVTECTLST